MAPSQAVRTVQPEERGQLSGSAVQPLRAREPSMAETTSKRLMREAGRARVIPPPLPRAVMRMPAAERRLTMRRMKAGGMSLLAATCRAVTRAPSPSRARWSTMRAA